MAKKVALLVKTTFISRVVVEVPENWDSTTKKELWLGNTIPLHGKMEDDIIKQTQTKLAECIADRSNVFENVEEVFNDVACPVDADDLK